MFVVLLLIGLLATMAGAATIGFGISISEFSLGHTLMLAGTMALSAGLILIGLATAFRQLHRIAETLMAHPEPRALRPAEQDTLAGTARPGTGRIPFPPKPDRDEPGQEVRAEPRFAPLPEQPGPQRTRPRPAAESETEEQEEEAPLSPQVPRGPPAPDHRGARLEPPWRPVASGERSSEPPPQKEPPWRPVPLGERSSEPQPQKDPPWRPLPPGEGPEPQPQKGVFDNLWPAGSRSAKRRKGPPAKSDEPAVAPKTPTEEPSTRSEKNRSVAILKSGVVDGMAYTLYADGSIEAELPEGTVRFASIDELRIHLEKHS